MTRSEPRDNKIVIVDDEPSAGKFFQQALEKHGYDCRLFAAAADAGAYLRTQTCDLLLCDVVMPCETGIEFVAGLKSEGLEAAVVMVTGYDDPGYLEAALALDAYGYLIKPVSCNQLVISVRNALQRRALERKVQRYIQNLEQNAARLNQTVAELRSANEKIVAQQKSVMEKERLKVLLETAGAAGHELNQPLTALMVHLELMETALNDPAKTADQLQAAQAAGRRLSEIVKKIQSIQRYASVPYHGEESIIDLDRSTAPFLPADK